MAAAATYELLHCLYVLSKALLGLHGVGGDAVEEDLWGGGGGGEGGEGEGEGGGGP